MVPGAPALDAYWTGNCYRWPIEVRPLTVQPSLLRSHALTRAAGGVTRNLTFPLCSLMAITFCMIAAPMMAFPSLVRITLTASMTMGARTLKT